MKALLILNDAAGSLNGDKVAVSASAVVEAFRAEGLDVEPRLAPATQLRGTLQAAVAARPDAVIVGGGDGSISTAAACLADTGIALGVLPLGTLNHFARDLGLPAGWRPAIAVLAHGPCRAIDVGEVNGHVFINNCSIGSYAEAVRKRDALRTLHGSGKWWAMFLATLAVFRRLRRLRLQIETNEATMALRTPFVVVSNNCYSGRVLDSSLRPRLDAGRIWIYTTRAHRHGAILRFAWQSLLRNIDAVDGLEVIETCAATVNHPYGKLHVAVDGELVVLERPLRFRIRPAALRVIVPQKTEASAAATRMETPALPGRA
jgi:diacylglycerol kinase family enzyme